MSHTRSDKRADMTFLDFYTSAVSVGPIFPKSASVDLSHLIQLPVLSDNKAFIKPLRPVQRQKTLKQPSID